MGKKRKGKMSYGILNGWVAGTMICATCNKSVEDSVSGHVRTKAYDDGTFNTWHRECTSDDPKWQEWDAERASNVVERRRIGLSFVADAKAFIEKQTGNIDGDAVDLIQEQIEEWESWLAANP